MQRDGTNRSLLGNYDIIGSATAVKSVKKEVCDLIDLPSARPAYLSSSNSPQLHPKNLTQPPQNSSWYLQAHIQIHSGGILSAYFISKSIAITIFTMQKKMNSDIWVIKDSVLCTVEVKKVNWSELNWNINSVSAASCFQTIGFLFMQEELWMIDCSSFPLQQILLDVPVVST